MHGVVEEHFAGIEAAVSQLWFEEKGEAPSLWVVRRPGELQTLSAQFRPRHASPAIKVVELCHVSLPPEVRSVPAQPHEVPLDAGTVDVEG